MEINKTSISQYYAIAMRGTLDEAIAGNALSYYHEDRPWDFAWGDFEFATMYNNETLLAQALLKARAMQSGRPAHGKVFPVLVNTSVSVMESDSLDSIILHIQRQQAMEKLSVEDQEALGLIGKEQ